MTSRSLPGSFLLPCKRERNREAYQPIAVLPERILSLAMRAVFVLFALIALVSVLESL